MQFSMFSLLVKEKVVSCLIISLSSSRFLTGSFCCQLYINEVVLGTAFGIIMGPHCANVFNPRTWGSNNSRVTLEIMRIVLATGLFAIGVELPKAYMAKHVKGLLVMVVPTMAFGWIVIAGTPPILSVCLYYSSFPLMQLSSTNCFQI
jgi:NhaP-type Na+/H+ or K+/H+ antiporter